MPTVTEMWSGQKWQRGVSASRSFQIYFTTSEEVNYSTAESALGNQFGVRHNTSHRFDARMLAQVPVISNDGGPYLLRADVTYARPSGGQQQEENPIDEAPRVNWSYGVELEPSDRDIEGNPVTNSAGSIYEGLTREVVVSYLRITRNESSYDPNFALAFMNTTNSDSFPVPGPSGRRYTVPALWAKCISILPAGDYTEDADYVPVEYTIAIKTPVTDFEKSGVSLWDWRLMDKGTTGLFTDTTTGKLQIGRFFIRGEPAGELRLDGHGKPFDVNLAVTCGEFVGATAEAALATPTGAYKEEKVKDAIFFWYKRAKRMAFSGMAL